MVKDGTTTHLTRSSPSMLRRTIQLLTLTLFAAFALAVSNAEAASISLINLYTCTDVIGTGTTCNQNPNIAMPTDLTDGGLNFRYQLDISSITGTWNATIFADDGTTDDTVAINGIVSDVNPVLFDFSAFVGVDFTALDSMLLTLQNTSAPGDSITVSVSAAVPEPSTAGMMLLGLFGLAAASPRKRMTA
jgi:hypothetical protein